MASWDATDKLIDYYWKLPDKAQGRQPQRFCNLNHCQRHIFQNVLVIAEDSVLDKTTREWQCLEPKLTAARVKDTLEKTFIHSAV